jgi:hypothetical protein
MYRVATFLLALAGACASTVLASAQAASSQTEASPDQTTSSTVAYVYVSNFPRTGNQISGWAVSSNGSLTKISGSPFKSNDFYMAVNGKWLFATDGVNIDSFSIASNGSLNLADSYLASGSGGLTNLFLDHTGGSLYSDYYTTNNDYFSYSINQSTGKITFLNDLAGGPSVGSVLSFLANNQFGYSSSCYHFTPSVFGVQRSADGSLAWLDINPALPTPPSGDFYCPWSAAADPSGHVAIAVKPYTSSWIDDGAYQLATYSSDSAGRLTTTNSHTNMPNVVVGTLTGYWMSPSGKFLGVAGSGGLQIFHFNGANPITKYTGLLVGKQVDQVFWDNANHLYAISRSAGKLYVFTVTSSSVTQAPGSPHSITSPAYLIVLPKS